MLEDNDIIVTELDMSKYKNNIIKIIGKDKKKSEHSFVTDLISFDNVITYLKEILQYPDHDRYELLDDMNITITKK